MVAVFCFFLNTASVHMLQCTAHMTEVTEGDWEE